MVIGYNDLVLRNFWLFPMLHHPQPESHHAVLRESERGVRESEIGERPGHAEMQAIYSDVFFVLIWFNMDKNILHHASKLFPNIYLI